MATKAERFKAETMAMHKRPATKKKVTAEKPHNLSARAGRKALVRYETQAEGASRKSTRGSAHHQRATNPLERTAKQTQAKSKTRATGARTKSLRVRGKGR
jgi:hypothetical protein